MALLRKRITQYIEFVDKFYYVVPSENITLNQKLIDISARTHDDLDILFDIYKGIHNTVISDIKPDIKYAYTTNISEYLKSGAQLKHDVNTYHNEIEDLYKKYCKDVIEEKYLKLLKEHADIKLEFEALKSQFAKN